jgi:sugar phosphate isomerase/epimerase
VKILKIAAAPISWGVCEVPGWGHELTPQPVLAEMRDVGLAATELGPEDFLPSDPDELSAAREVPGRIAHAHLKDVDAALAARVQAGELTYTEAVRDGIYTPLGGGDIDIDIAGIVTVLHDNGFDGWFVMEQDTILDSEPTDEGPVRDVRTSVAYMADVCRSVPV